MKQQIFTFAVVGFFVWASFAQAEMTSGNYIIRWDTVSTGGSDTASSATYLLHDTAESTTAGSSTSSSYELAQGYRVDTQLLTFEVVAEDTSTGRSATSLSGTTVTADPTGLVVNDLIALVQDEGASEVSAIGRIVSIGAGTITVDVWKNAGSSPVIDGTNDKVYRLSGTSVVFGTLSTSSVSTAIIAFEVTAVNDNGYVVQMYEDGNLRAGSSEIPDVTDGSVSAGSQEYGARSSDTTISTSTFDTADTGITTTFQDVASESTASFESRNFVTLKTSISSATTAGGYAHTISVIASANF
ncbi:hypothetical protein COV05_04665 [Candidatus Uhrbacteria bacterium CG10_big_fil_rev_8_21_14_0_10_48_16]|uniref:Uncharacterized protein n=1 Tax=Candidatus Uhrbacteria bacterium CG10_big_fil_rev_8_21_14_0_10_48_16 TaxID=1975038 RepID=A0A2M8LG46_9BACT|nr:MAG: hypothetical protein COV05_04665 [Candidatus Uhrbacteria bacterium CG10_big_fil_rev_8_21_14_0_10_48_16]